MPRPAAPASPGGHRIGERGYFYAPTVLADVPLEADAMTSEPFGPLGLCVPVASLDEGLELANKLSVGLSAYAFTNSLHDAERISRELECGVLTLNSFATPGADAPFGGVKESGIGREGGAESLDAYLVSKTVLQSTARESFPPGPLKRSECSGHSGRLTTSGNSQGGNRRRRRHGARHRTGVRSGRLRRAAVRHGRGACRGASARRGDAIDLSQGVAKGRLAQEEADATLARIQPASRVGQLGRLRSRGRSHRRAKLEPKQQLFRSLEAIVSPECILATNTSRPSSRSSLSVTAIAAACARDRRVVRQPQRVAGWHFFNPVPRMRLVEVVQAPRTSDRSSSRW
jgi:hypothetical protein